MARYSVWYEVSVDGKPIQGVKSVETDSADNAKEVIRATLEDRYESHEDFDIVSLVAVEEKS